MESPIASSRQQPPAATRRELEAYKTFLEETVRVRQAWGLPEPAAHQARYAEVLEALAALEQVERCAGEQLTLFS
jgi:hypothetical protein